MSSKYNIPTGWKREKIGKIATFQRGFDLPNSDRIEGTYPIVSSGGVSGWHNKPMAKGPGVVTGRYGSIGIVYFIKGDYWPLNTALWVNNFHGNDHKFIYYLTSTFDFKKLSDKTGVPGVNRNDLHSLTALLPPFHEQKAIVSTIEKWDNSIALTENLLIAKQERRTWLMQQLLTGKRRLPGFERAKKLQKTPFGSLPADWAYPRIGEVSKEVSERNGEDVGRPVLSCTKHKGLVDSLAYFGKQIFSKDLSNYKVVLKGQFAYATNHIDEGSIGYLNTYEEALISPIYTVFQADKTIVDNFLLLVLKTETYRHIFASNTSASVDRRGSLRWSDFAKIHVPRPAFEEQQAIVSVIDTADRELALLHTQLDALREQKKGLMQQLLTGKIRVKVNRTFS